MGEYFLKDFFIDVWRALELLFCSFNIFLMYTIANRNNNINDNHITFFAILNMIVLGIVYAIVGPLFVAAISGIGSSVFEWNELKPLFIACFITFILGSTAKPPSEGKSFFGRKL